MTALMFVEPTSTPTSNGLSGIGRVAVTPRGPLFVSPTRLFSHRRPGLPQGVRHWKSECCNGDSTAMCDKEDDAGTGSDATSWNRGSRDSGDGESRPWG